MKDFWKDFNISEEYKNNGFLISLSETYKEKDLTYNQVNAVNDIIGKVEELPEYDTIEIYKLKRYFNRVDYHGDPLVDFRFVYVKDLKAIDLESEIYDENGLNHGVEQKIKEYEIVETIKIPKTKNISLFMIYYDDYDFITKKLARNKFRSIKSKNQCIRAIKSLVSCEIDETLINKCTGKFYNHNKKC